MRNSVAKSFLGGALLLAGSVFQAQASCPPDPSGPMITSPIPGKTGLDRILTPEMWNEFFKGLATPEAHGCTGKLDFYSLDSFFEAAKAFPEFANSGDFAKDRREVAAFLSHVSHETSGGWATAPCGNFAWGLCWKEEVGCEKGGCEYCWPAGNGDVCVNDKNMGYPCPCAAGKRYYGRGPMQLSYNSNYAFFSMDFYGNQYTLLNDPDRVHKDPVVAWQSALWFWHKPQSPKPSCHDVMTERWQPTEDQRKAGWKPGFGMTTNIINGGVECGCGADQSKTSVRVGYYNRFTSLLGVHPCNRDDETLWCHGQQSFPSFPYGSCAIPPPSTECAGAPSRVPEPEVTEAPEPGVTEGPVPEVTEAPEVESTTTTTITLPEEDEQSEDDAVIADSAKGIAPSLMLTAFAVLAVCFIA